MDTQPKPNCYACAHCGYEPDAPDLLCFHKDSPTIFGLYIRDAAASDGHCGPNRTKFEQHPGRNPDGTLKNTNASRH